MSDNARGALYFWPNLDPVAAETYGGIPLRVAMMAFVIFGPALLRSRIIPPLAPLHGAEEVESLETEPVPLLAGPQSSFDKWVDAQLELDVNARVSGLEAFKSFDEFVGGTISKSSFDAYFTMWRRVRGIEAVRHKGVRVFKGIGLRGAQA